MFHQKKSKFSLKLLVLGLSASVCLPVYASSDNYCVVSMGDFINGSLRCNNFPILVPDNNTRVNFQLQLIDKGLSKLKPLPINDDDTQAGYPRVPFSIDQFEAEVIAGTTRAVTPTTTTSTEAEEENDWSVAHTRCQSNLQGSKAFIQALKNTPSLLPAERSALEEQRKKIKPDCEDIKTAQALSNAPLKTPMALEFAQYLAGATAFYQGDFKSAQTLFVLLNQSKQPWIKETALYMLARTALNEAQTNSFEDDQLDIKKIEKSSIAQAEDGFKKYLTVYPNGLYTRSARGLLRRVYWLKGDTTQLVNEYVWQATHPKSNQTNLDAYDLGRELDSKIFSEDTLKDIKSPLLLATLDLMLMREQDQYSKVKRLTVATLDSQKAIFDTQPELFRYLKAMQLLYVEEKPDLAWTYLPADMPTTPLSYLEFSQQVLKGLILEQKNRTLDARVHWLQLMPVAKQPLQASQLELALAINYEKTGEVAKVFEENPLVRDQAMRRELIVNVASPEILRQIFTKTALSVDERRTALYTLLFKELLSGRYSDYLEDVKLMSLVKPASKKDSSTDLAWFNWSGAKLGIQGVSCSTVLEHVKVLAKTPKSNNSVLCMAEFMRTKNWESDQFLNTFRPIEKNTDPKKPTTKNITVLGTSKPAFTGKLWTRTQAYQTVMTATDKTPEQEAYALYRAIQCYAPSGYNGCDGDDVPLTTRKAWFQTIKTKYPTSSWAKSLKYYW